MLSIKEKRRIMDEEIFREATRKQLASNRPTGSNWRKLWSFLNTSFALWFLSTIVVGLATWAYSSHQDMLRSAARDRETLQKLDTETAGRLQYCVQFIEGRRLKLD